MSFSAALKDSLTAELVVFHPEHFKWELNCLIYTSKVISILNFFTQESPPPHLWEDIKAYVREYVGCME